MTTDIEHAKHLLGTGGYTCVLCRGEAVFTATADGISPMLDFISSETELKGFSAADKIVGKAAAMLFCLAGVISVYGDVVSENAVFFCHAHGIDITYGECVPFIVNRTGTGRCPMEETVMGIDDVHEACAALMKKRDELRRMRSHQEAN